MSSLDLTERILAIVRDVCVVGAVGVVVYLLRERMRVLKERLALAEMLRADNAKKIIEGQKAMFEEERKQMQAEIRRLEAKGQDRSEELAELREKAARVDRAQEFVMEFAQQTLERRLKAEQNLCGIFHDNLKLKDFRNPLLRREVPEECLFAFWAQDLLDYMRSDQNRRKDGRRQGE